MHPTFYLLPLLLNLADATLLKKGSTGLSPNNNLFIRQSGVCTTGKACGDGCVRFTDSCCGTDGSSCPSGTYCVGTLGCCDNGEICSNEVSHECAGDLVECDDGTCVAPGESCTGGSGLGSGSASLSSTSSRSISSVAAITTSTGAAAAAPATATRTSTSEVEDSSSSSSTRSTTTRTTSVTTPTVASGGSSSQQTTTAAAGGGGASGAGKALDMAWIGGGMLALMGYAAVRVY